MQLWQQSLAARQSAGPAPSSAPIAPAGASTFALPGGLTPAALGAMIQNPATRAEGLALWQQTLAPKQAQFAKAGETAFVNGRPVYQVPNAPMDVAPGHSVVNPNSGGTIAAVPAEPVKVGAGESLVSPAGGPPIFTSPALQHFTSVNGRVVASDQQRGTSRDVTPAGVPTDADLKAAEGTNTDIIGKVSASQTQALAASRTLDAIQRQQEALDKGTFTGGGASTKLAISNALAGILGIDSDKVANTQEFIAAANSKAAEIARQLSQSGHTTNADLNMAKVIGGADINSSLGTLREIGRAQQQLALDTINRHNASVDEGGKLVPPLAQRADFYKVPAPKGYDFATTGALSKARAALAVGAPRDAVLKRLQGAGIDPGRL